MSMKDVVEETRVILEKHEAETGRCYARACVHNTEEGCEKPVDKLCPQLWLLSGNSTAGMGQDLRRKWVKKEAEEKKHDLH